MCYSEQLLKKKRKQATLLYVCLIGQVQFQWQIELVQVLCVMTGTAIVVKCDEHLNSLVMMT